jgi:hypothetical protein
MSPDVGGWVFWRSIPLTIIRVLHSEKIPGEASEFVHREIASIVRRTSLTRLFALVEIFAEIETLFGSHPELPDHVIHLSKVGFSAHEAAAGFGTGGRDARRLSALPSPF